ncbi:MAG: hypothetical protein H7274_19650 [Rhodoferax sp.]|nr:hypothetical protein [Rhodoferax sp.]
MAALLAPCERMVREPPTGLTAGKRRFQLLLVLGRPDRPARGVAHAEHLPGIRWKLQNLALIERKSPVKFPEQAGKQPCRALAQRRSISSSDKALPLSFSTCENRAG